MPEGVIQKTEDSRRAGQGEFEMERFRRENGKRRGDVLHHSLQRSGSSHIQAKMSPNLFVFIRMTSVQRRRAN